MKVLALDPATRCGFAHSDGFSGTWDLSVRRDESGGMRLLRLIGKLNEVKVGAGVELVVYEAARHGAPKMQGALVVQAEIQGVIKAWCEHNGVQYRGYSPSEIKRYATGKGNATKDAVLRAAQGRHWVVESHDEADALWLLHMAMNDLPEGKP